MERANEAVVPTVRLTSVEAAYWCQIRDRFHLRWVVPHDEDTLLDALARLHAAGADTVGEGSRYVGVVPGARAGRAGLGPGAGDRRPRRWRSRSTRSPAGWPRRWPTTRRWTTRPAGPGPACAAGSSPCAEPTSTLRDDTALTLAPTPK